MATLTGILLDVSGSMEANAGAGIYEEGGAWIRSIFKVTDDLIQNDVSSKNHVFAVGFGADQPPEIFDIISTVNQVKEVTPSAKKMPSYDDVLEDIYRKLERNGAIYLRQWAEKQTVKRAISLETAFLLLTKLNSDDQFLHMFVYDWLPGACRQMGGGVGVLQGLFTSSVSSVIKADESTIKEVVNKAFRYMSKGSSSVGNDVGLLQVGNQSVFTVHDATDIIRGCIGDKELSEERIDNLMRIVRPFIFGGTPLFSALEKAMELLMHHRFDDYKKILFVLSDGQPADHGNIDLIKARLKAANITVVGCFITSSTNVESQRLYYEVQNGWDKGANFLFDLSSTLPANMLPRAIFIKRGWNINIENNETKLFLQVNHPDNIRDACDLARNVVSCQDALSDILTSVSLDVYISRDTSMFEAPEQVGGTCYANASAAVLHLSMMRILGRDGGHPTFESLREKLIRQYGVDGANTFQVLRQICPKYRLNVENVDVIGAMKAIREKRPVVARFRLIDSEWDSFRNFFRKKENKKGILSTRELDINKRPRSAKTSGHAVVLTSYNSECLRLMNSWGMDWADGGFFRIENSKVLNLEFFDVFWTLDDLSRQEKEYYEEHGPKVAQDLIEKFKGLQKATYECPLCKQISLVSEFTGTLVQTMCPKCRQVFKSDGTGNVLALNIYLTSLCT